MPQRNPHRAVRVREVGPDLANPVSRQLLLNIVPWLAFLVPTGNLMPTGRFMAPYVMAPAIAMRQTISPQTGRDIQKH